MTSPYEPGLWKREKRRRRIEFTIIFGIIAGIVTIVYLLKNTPKTSSNVVDIVGVWIQDDILYHREAKKTDKPTGNLSDAYGEIKIIFYTNFTYKSYFDATSSNGEWKIENDSLYMIGHNKKDKFKYKLNNDELIIYSYPWLMALKKERDS